MRTNRRGEHVGITGMFVDECRAHPDRGARRFVCIFLKNSLNQAIPELEPRLVE
jgi:hypothetical protein